MNLDVAKYASKDELIRFSSFLLSVDPLLLKRTPKLWNSLTLFERASIKRLQSFKSLCRHLPKNHFPDAFHLWTAEANGLDYFLMVDRKFANAVQGISGLNFRCRPISPEGLLKALSVPEIVPNPFSNHQNSKIG